MVAVWYDMSFIRKRSSCETLQKWVSHPYGFMISMIRMKRCLEGTGLRELIPPQWIDIRSAGSLACQEYGPYSLQKIIHSNDLLILCF
jgi:hypothetical protein